MKKEIKRKATICFGRDSRNLFNLTVRDESSYQVFFEMEVDPESLILAITGRADMQASYTLETAKIANLGKTRENKTVMVDRSLVCKKTYYRTAKPEIKKEMQESVIAAVAKTAADEGWPMDGWRVSDYGFTTQQKGEKWKVNLIRFVDPAV